MSLSQAEKVNHSNGQVLVIAEDSFGSAVPTNGSRSGSQAKEAFTVDEVAEKLSVSRRQVQYWIGDGTLASVLLPGTIRARRVTRAQLDAFLLGAELASGFRRPRSVA